MEDLLINTLREYIEDIKEARELLIEKFGNVHFLRAKNKGNIPSKIDNVTKSTIKSFGFHGRGCFFVKKRYGFDIEFDLETNALGFTKWTFMQYLKSKLDLDVDESQVESIINKLGKEIRIRFYDGVYFPHL